MVDRLLELADGRLIIPLIALAAGIALVKSVFSLVRFRSRDRRDFLDLFRDHETQSDVWMTVAVRHAFGAYLPVALIRKLMQSPQPGRALLEVGAAWDFIDIDDETGELMWRRSGLRTAKAREWIALALGALYFLLASLSLWLTYLCVKGIFVGDALWVAWVYAVLSGLGAFGCLFYGDNLKNADRAARRWLGMT